MKQIEQNTQLLIIAEYKVQAISIDYKKGGFLCYQIKLLIFLRKL
jgi:hypothetical protein